MKVTCPHCAANYNIDDRRIPSAGLNVKCPKCAAAFPVSREAPPPAAPAEEAFSFDQAPASIPLPAPDSPIAPPPPPPSPFTDNPFGAPPAAESPFTDNPFGAPPAAESPFTDNPFAAAPLQPPQEAPFSFDQQPGAGPLPVDDGAFAFEGEGEAPQVEEIIEEEAPLPPPSSGPAGFGEIDFASAGEPLPPPVPAPDPFASSPLSAPAAGGEELEDLFGEAKKGAAAPAALAFGAATGPLSMDARYQVRRRSGKVFGPFDADAVAEMLQKGELQGNEDVSADGGDSWQPMSAVPAFRDAAGKANAPPPPAVGGVPSVPYGARMAPVKVGEGGVLTAARPRWLKYAIAGALVVVLAGVGVAGTFTPYGLFFLRAFRSDAERNRVAAIVGKAKAGLARGDFAGEREALKLAGEALAAAPDDADARLAYVLAATAVERRHAATADGSARAAKAAKELADDEPGSAHALAAELALAVGSGDSSSLAQRESALEQAIAKGRTDPEVVALLARSALTRRDGARAAAQFKVLEGLQPGTPRASLGSGLALVAQGKGAEALAIFEKALAADATLADARIEGAAVAAASGDAEKAKGLLAPLLEPAAAGGLAPLDRARVNTVSASILGGRAADAPQVEKLLSDAVAADARYRDARVALATHRLARGDAAGAVAATDPVAAGAAKDPSLADVRVRSLVAAGRALDASVLVEQALAASPGSPRLLVARGMVQEQTGKLAEAKASYRDAVARAPTEWEPRIALARLAMAGKELPLAQAEIAAAVERSPGVPATHAALGDLKALQGDRVAADAAYRKALALDDEHTPALVGLARIALAAGDAPSARASIDRALAIDPGRADARRLRGELYWKAGELEAAEADFQAVTEQQARDPLGFVRLGAVKVERGDAAGAVRVLENATGLDPNLAEAQYWLGRALVAKGEMPGALTRLKRAIQLDPATSVHHLWLGVALERTNSLGEAVEAYRAAAAADPKLVDAHERIGNLFAGAGRCDEAIPAFGKALAAAPGTLKFKIAIADCRAKQDKQEEALRLYREVLKAEPSSPTVPYKMARALHESAGVKEAVPWYERAVRVEPENPMPYYFLGFAYKDRGQRAKAVQFFRQYLAKRPDAEDKKDIELEIEDLGG